MNNSHSRSFFREWIHQPRSLWLRKAIFQIHLWVGVALAVYVAIIGVTGSILVFEDELHRLTGNHRGDPVRGVVSMADAGLVASQTAPGKRITLAFPPTAGDPAYAFVIANHADVYVDANSGKQITPADEDSWLDLISDLHVELALGDAGDTINGAGAVGLFLLGGTGLTLWWPGISSIARSLRVDFRRGWKRIVWDLHALSGLCGVVMVAMWSLTGIWFTWSNVLRAPLGWISPITKPAIPSLAGEEVPVHAMIARAETFASQLPGRFRWVLLPAKPGQPLTIVVSREMEDHALHYDQIYVDPATGKRVGAWLAEDGKSFSDWLIRLAYPLHTGLLWGALGKILWAILGLLLPFLAVTGLIMYWNRYLGKQWSTLRGSDS